MKNSNYTKGEWHLNNPTDDNGDIIIKTNPQFGDQEYFAISIKNSFDIVGFYYPSSKQSREEMIANAKIICKAVNEYNKLKEENALLIEALDELYRWAESVQGQEVSRFITKTPDSIFTMAKKLLDNLKK